jgi:hypothetical protein
MRVEVTPSVDTVPGQRYEYDLYRFSDDNITLVARGYSHAPTEAHFLRIETGSSSAGITSADLTRPLLKEAVLHLRSIGKTSLEWLNIEGDGYEPVR